jgi:hypothetical protein
VRTKPERRAFEQCPRKGNEKPEADPNIAVDPYETQGVLDIPIAPLMAIDIHNVVEAPEKSRKQHHRNRDPGKFSLPVEKDGNKGNCEYNKKASHNRDA